MLDDAKRHEVLARSLLPRPAQDGGVALVIAAARKAGGVHHLTVARSLAEYGIQPWRLETFKFSTDPELEAKVRDVVGLYVHPPDKVVVLCVEE